MTRRERGQVRGDRTIAQGAAHGRAGVGASVTGGTSRTSQAIATLAGVRRMLVRLGAGGVAVVLVTAGCTSGGATTPATPTTTLGAATSPSSPGSPSSGTSPGRASAAPTVTPDADALPVTAAFYPLEYALAHVGGSRVRITTLTAPGVEPHDLELTPRDVAGLAQARLVVTLGGFQPAVDEAAAAQAAATTLDVSAAAGLDLAPAHDPDHAGHSPDEQDPHFWLDPTRLAAVGGAIAERLEQLDPAHAAVYQANAEAFADLLGELDAAYETGLGSCTVRSFVTSHAAFGYLAQRYQLTQVPIAGVSPDQEPSAKQLATIATAVREQGVSTIYAETLVDPKFAQTVATATGAAVGLLDPIEGITATSPGGDYRAVMLANLTALRTGQKCP